MNKRTNSSSDRKPAGKKDFRTDDGRKGADDRKPFKRAADKEERKPYPKKDGERKPYAGKSDRSFSEDRPAKRFSEGDKKFSDRKKEYKPKTEGTDRPGRKFSDRDRPFSDRKPGSDDFKAEGKPRDKDKFADRKSTGAHNTSDRKFGDKSFKKEYKPRTEGGPDRTERKFSDKEGGKKEYRPRPKTGEADRTTGDKPFKKEFKPRTEGTERPGRKFGDKEGAKRPYKPRTEAGTEGDRPFKKEYKPRAESDKRERPSADGERKKFDKKDGSKKFADKAFKKQVKPRPVDPAVLQPEVFDDKIYGELAEDEPKTTFRPGRTTRTKPEERESRRVSEETAIESAMTLNKYIAHSGECSRRDAAAFVKEGKVRVNGELILDPGYRIAPGDQVTLSGKKLTPQKGLVYILLNKPKGFITTTEDPQERKTVMDLVANADVERLYPVGRLDRNTTGLLLMTNDGSLAHKLSHPSYNIKKVYQVTLDKNLSNADYQKIVKGLELEDGPVTVDEIAYLEHRNELGLEIHSGRNRIVRRIFESLGYEVEKLDRVMYAGLTKKNLPRSKWRFLSEKEIILLKHFKG